MTGESDHEKISGWHTKKKAGGIIQTDHRHDSDTSFGRCAWRFFNVFVFFAGMAASYYLYSKLAAGFFPKSYALVWAGFTAISPLLAFICWYAKGKGKLSLGISSLVIAVLFNASFSYGWLYFNMRSIPELLTFICGAAVLRRHSAKDTAVMIAAGIAGALLLHLIVPFRFG